MTSAISVLHTNSITKGIFTLNDEHNSQFISFLSAFIHNIIASSLVFEWCSYFIKNVNKLFSETLENTIFQKRLSVFFLFYFIFTILFIYLFITFNINSLERDGLRQAELCPRHTMKIKENRRLAYPMDSVADYYTP